MPDPTNPYMPSNLDKLSMMLMALGSGVSNASMSGRSGWDGLPMAGMMYGGALNQANQRALEADRWEKQYGEQAAYRRAQEDALRSQTEQRQQELDITKKLLAGFEGGGVPGMAPPAGPTAAQTPGFAAPPMKPTIGPGQEALAGGPRLVNAVYADATAGLPGLTLPVTSAARTPQQNAAAGGAQNSQHLDGNALDISLKGMSDDQKQSVVSRFLSDPRVGGFGYYPETDSIHIDTRSGGRMAWGADQTVNTVGRGWPQWMTDTVGRWRQGVQLAQAQAPSPGNPQIQPPQGGATTVQPPRVDPMRFLPFTLSRTLAPFGRAGIQLGNSETDRYLRDLDREQKERQFNREQGLRERTQGATERNQKVGPDGRPNQSLIEADTEEARRKNEIELDSRAATALVTQAVNQFVEKDRPKAVALQETIPQLHNMRRLITAGAMTGPGLESRNFLLQLANTVGLNIAPEQATLTPAYMAALAQQITANAKTLGINPTDRDAQIVKEAQGANANTSKEAMLRLLSVQENIQRQAHDRYIAEAKRIMSLRGVKAAYGDDYFMLPSPPSYDEWLRANPLPGGSSIPEPPDGFRRLQPGGSLKMPPPPAGYRPVP
jgi:hypothetical protein